jgi:hypothetical protein
MKACGGAKAAKIMQQNRCSGGSSSARAYAAQRQRKREISNGNWLSYLWRNGSSRKKAYSWQ